MKDNSFFNRVDSENDGFAFDHYLPEWSLQNPSHDPPWSTLWRMNDPYKIMKMQVSVIM